MGASGRLAAPFSFSSGLCADADRTPQWIWLGVCSRCWTAGTRAGVGALNILLSFGLIRRRALRRKRLLRTLRLDRFAFMVCGLWRCCRWQRNVSITARRDGCGPSSAHTSGAMWIGNHGRHNRCGIIAALDPEALRQCGSSPRYRRSCLRLAGAKGIFVSSHPISGFVPACAYYPCGCSSFGAARAPSSRQGRSRASCCNSSAGTPWRFMPSSLRAPSLP